MTVQPLESTGQSVIDEVRAMVAWQLNERERFNKRNEIFTDLLPEYLSEIGKDHFEDMTSSEASEFYRRFSDRLERDGTLHAVPAPQLSEAAKELIAAINEEQS